MKTYSFTGRSRRAAEAALRRIESRNSALDSDLERKVRHIVQGVRRGGDAALRGYASRFDGFPNNSSLRVEPEEMRAAWQQLSPDQQSALRLAAQRIRAFAQRQRPREWSATDSAGMRLGQILRPLDAIACYVPAGRHPLPSTLLMTAIPAQLAGVPRIVILCPQPSTMVLAAAHLLGIREMLRIGGAHAIAAAAFGTETIVSVDKICGPGSAFVTTAKQIIVANPACSCSIDMAAGPTETLIASRKGNPPAIAADLVAQAEHDPATLAVFVTTEEKLAAEVSKEVARQSRDNPVAAASLRSRGAIFVVADTTAMADAVNRIAPEHLTVDTEEDLAWVRNAGSVFVGTETPQAMGDYISGPNHTLPTGGRARQRGGLSVTDFLKLITVQSATPQAIARLAPSAALLADAEGLTAHASSLRAAMKRAGVCS